MKTQVTIVAALLILVALSSNLDMLVEAQGPVDCNDACTTGCVKPTTKETIRCHHKCAKKVRPRMKPKGCLGLMLMYIAGDKSASETGA